MKLKSAPSLYRYWSFFDSRRTDSTFTPALNVLSMMRPVLMSRSFVRTKALPLPGFTCWNSTMVHSLPLYSMHMPFLKSAVEIATLCSFKNEPLQK